LSKEVRIISLFSGIGGFDLGALGGFRFLGRNFTRQMTKIVLALDNDREACSVYGENIGRIKHADIRDVTEFPTADIVIGGPPCQPFSQAGKRIGKSDERNLIPEFIRVIKIVKPKAFLLENTKSLCHGRNENYLLAIMNDLKIAGYNLEFKVLNAADFGVPQTRERLFIQGFKKNPVTKIPWPKAGYKENPGPEEKEWISCRAAICDIGNRSGSLIIKGLKEGQRRYPKFGSGARRQIADRPMFTITAQDTKCNKKIHPWYDRRLSMSELKRGMGFPDDFILWKKSVVLGNAVPPPVSYALIKTMVHSLFC